jgi:hypothetical protein
LNAWGDCTQGNQANGSGLMHDDSVLFLMLVGQRASQAQGLSILSHTGLTIGVTAHSRFSTLIALDIGSRDRLWSRYFLFRGTRILASLFPLNPSHNRCMRPMSCDSIIHNDFFFNSGFLGGHRTKKVFLSNLFSKRVCIKSSL